MYFGYFLYFYVLCAFINDKKYDHFLLDRNLQPQKSTVSTLTAYGSLLNGQEVIRIKRNSTGIEWSIYLSIMSIHMMFPHMTQAFRGLGNLRRIDKLKRFNVLSRKRCRICSLRN